MAFFSLLGFGRFLANVAEIAEIAWMAEIAWVAEFAAFALG